MIESIGAATTPEVAPATGFGQLGTDTFLKLLVAQLKYQNPMAPTDGAAMLEQTAQFTTIETLQAISAVNQRLMGFQQVTMALTVIGKPVQAISVEGLPVEGIAESVRFTADGPFLRLDSGLEIPMDNVVSVGASGVADAVDAVIAAMPPAAEPVVEPTDEEAIEVADPVDVPPVEVVAETPGPDASGDVSDPGGIPAADRLSIV